MSDLFNPEFLDFIRALNSNDVEYIVVDGYAVILHGYNRANWRYGCLGKQNS
jgi:hypothetical protein